MIVELKTCGKKGYSINQHWMFFTNLKLWLIESEKLFGKRYCPCFEPSGDPEFDRKLICPCEFMNEEIEQRGTCHCTLFGKKELIGKDHKEAEARLLEEYRGKINLKGRVLDTRGTSLDPLGSLPIPDPLHQTKRALSMVGTPLKVTVNKKAFAEHIVKLASTRGLRGEVSEENESIIVNISR